MEIDLYSDWINLLRHELQQMGYPCPAATQAEDVAVRFFNVLNRTVTTRKYNVHRSAEFSCPQDHLGVVEKIEETLAGGLSVRPHQSRRLSDPDYDDDMLSDWGIHHLHLSTDLEGDGFVRRTGPLLYLTLSRFDAYLIDVREHGHWTSQDLLEIIHSNWPEITERYRLQGVKSVPSITNAEVKKLRGGHCNTVLMLKDGTVLAPIGGGMMTSGVSFLAVRAHDRHARYLKQQEQWIKNNAEMIRRGLGEQYDGPENWMLKLESIDERGALVMREAACGGQIELIPGERNG